jgi:hypothetical protein
VIAEHCWVSARTGAGVGKDKLPRVCVQTDPPNQLHSRRLSETVVREDWQFGMNLLAMVGIRQQKFGLIKIYEVGLYVS